MGERSDTKNRAAAGADSLRLCRLCNETADLLPYRVARGDYVCRTCHLNEIKKYPRRRAYLREYNAKRAQDPKYRDQEIVRHRRTYERHRDTPEYKAAHAAAQRKYRNDPALREKHEARYQVSRALAAGRLTKQPCEKCADPRTQAHHDDYSKPLDVRWLCAKHHAEHHAAAHSAGIKTES